MGYTRDSKMKSLLRTFGDFFIISLHDMSVASAGTKIKFINSPYTYIILDISDSLITIRMVSDTWTIQVPFNSFNRNFRVIE